MLDEHEAHEGAHGAPDEVAAEVPDPHVALAVDGAVGLLPGLCVRIEQAPQLDPSCPSGKRA